MTEVITKLKTGSVYESKRNYSRAVVVGGWVYMSNTAGVNYQTRQMSEDATEQAEQCFSNISGALAAVGSSLKDIVRAHIFIPHLESKDEVMDVVGEKFRGIDPAITVTATPLAGPAYRVEIEITAFLGAGAATTEYKTVKL